MQDNASNVIPARAEFSAQQAELAGRVARNTPAPGLNDTCVPGLALIRADAPSEPLPSAYHPSLCVVVQGRKRALLGDEVFVYDPLNYLVVSMTLRSAAHPSELQTLMRLSSAVFCLKKKNTTYIE